jgi:3-hydroxymyristoyl/3-hydroxydecanoyl-(acyl carrier protein) dehydratase
VQISKIMIQAVEFLTMLTDNTRIEIPIHFQSQLKENQVVRVIILIDETDLKELKK